MTIHEMGILMFLLLSLLDKETGGVGVKEDYWEDGEVLYDRELDNEVEESSEVEDTTVETPVESNNTESTKPLDVNDSEIQYSVARTVGEG